MVWCLRAFEVAINGPNFRSRTTSLQSLLWQLLPLVYFCQMCSLDADLSLLTAALPEVQHTSHRVQSFSLSTKSIEYIHTKPCSNFNIKFHFFFSSKHFW